MDNNSEISNNGTLLFNRLLALGVVIALILFGIAAIYAVYVYEKKLEADSAGDHVNPIFGNIKGAVETGENPLPSDNNDIPDIPGVRVYSAEKDADLIDADAAAREKEFNKNIHSETDDSDAENRKNILIEKNRFAAERLEFLKKVEAAETREERQRLIRQFEMQLSDADKK